MKGREESVSKKGIEACCGYWSAANYSGIWWKDWKRRSATTPLERNRPRVFFYLAFSSGWTIQLGGRYKIQCPVLREKGGREGGRAR